MNWALRGSALYLRTFRHINSIRCFSSATKPDQPLFPHKDEFPNRHIGPRDSDIIVMLDTIGFKVCKKCLTKNQNFYFISN